jgi:hypothetical protein
MLAAVLLGALAATAEYSVTWSTIDGGGGTSTGGVYSVSGTIGQPDAGQMSGGNYSLTGGFWAVTAVQTPGAPTLRVLSSNNVVKVYWSLPADGWTLSKTTTLEGNPPPWGQVSPSLYRTNASEIYITLTSPTGNAFYRLSK